MTIARRADALTLTVDDQIQALRAPGPGSTIECRETVFDSLQDALALLERLR